MLRELATLTEEMGRYQLSLRSALVLVAVLSFLLAIVTTATQGWRRLQLQTVSARMSDSRSLWFGGVAHAPASGMRELRCASILLKAHGSRTRLLVEYEDGVGEADVNELLRAGHDAGFDVVEAIRLPSAK